MVYALISVFNPKEYIVDNVSIISRQVDKVFISDNSTGNNEKMFNALNNSVYLYNEGNLGLSQAFNKVLKTYDFNNNDYIFFFDQDSRVTANHILDMINNYATLEKLKKRIGCIGPFFFNTSSNKIERPKAGIKVIDGIYRVKSVITSSMLCKYGTLKDVNFWNEDIFLDMADWDLCWRMMKNKYGCYMTDNVIMEHTLGLGENHIGKFRVKIGNPIREYYQTRDCQYLLWKSYTPLKFRIRFILMLTLRPVIHSLFLDNVKDRKKYIKRGKKDYRLRIHGEYKD